MHFYSCATYWLYVQCMCLVSMKTYRTRPAFGLLKFTICAFLNNARSHGDFNVYNKWN